MKRISLFLSVPQYRALKQRAQQSGLGLSELIRRAIDLLLQTPT